MELFFDTETSGLYKFKLPYSDPSQPWVVQLGMILSDRDFIYHEVNMIIRADDRIIEPGAEQVHCISKEISNRVGIPENLALTLFNTIRNNADICICHNFDFDAGLMRAMHHRVKIPGFEFTKSYCTMKSSTDLCKLPGRYGYKWPKLQELHKFLFGEEFVDAHDALADVRATRRCYYEMVKEA